MDTVKEIIEEECHRIEVDHDVILAFASAERLAEKTGFPSMQCKEISICASELANNIVKYAGSGMLVLRVWEDTSYFFEIIAEDRGRGISDIDTALKEFHTESGPVVTPGGRIRPITEGLGCGLSAVQRLMDGVAILSHPGRGTIVRALKRIKPL